MSFGWDCRKKLGEETRGLLIRVNEYRADCVVAHVEFHVVGACAGRSVCDHDVKPFAFGCFSNTSYTL